MIRMKKVFCRERKEENGRGEEEKKRKEKERKEEKRRKSFCFKNQKQESHKNRRIGWRNL